MTRKRILTISCDFVGPRMASQAIRLWELSRVLAKHCEVVLLAANVAACETPGFRLVQYSPEQLDALAEWADAIVCTEGTFRFYPRVGKFKRPIAMDLACPTLIEGLELKRHWERPEPWRQTLEMYLRRAETLEPFCRGDFFFCGSPRQRDFSLGVLASLGRINPFTYFDDLQLRRFVRVIPFGVPEEAARHTKDVLRGVVPGIERDDFVLMWAGGVWVWFDPWTLLEAMARLRDELPKVKLYFLGVTPPHPDLNWFAFNDPLFERARELGVFERNVFINTGWTGYEERANYLLEADVGVTTQMAHLETHFALRTRAFDYVWAGLPLLSTQGDWMAELIEQKGLGLVVPPGDAGALADAIRRLCVDEPMRRQMRERVPLQAREWTWERICEPLVEFCMNPRFAPDREFRVEYVGRPRWQLAVRNKWKIFRRDGFVELLRSFKFLMPLRRIRVAFRDEGFRAGFQQIWREVRHGA